MTIFRNVKNKQNPYVVINKNCLQDKNLSWQAKGLLGYFLSLPDDWTININEIISHAPNGKASTYNIVKELIQYGYVRRICMKDEKGKIIKWEYQVYESPLSDFQDVDNPDLENQHLLINEIQLCNENTYIGDSENSSPKQPKQAVEKQTFFEEELIPVTEAQEIALEAGIHESWIELQWNDFKEYWSNRRDKKAKKTIRGWKQTWRNNCLAAPHRVSKPKPTIGNTLSNSTSSSKKAEEAIWIYDDLADRNVKITITGYDKGEDQYGYNWNYIRGKWWRCGQTDEERREKSRVKALKEQEEFFKALENEKNKVAS